MVDRIRELELDNQLCFAMYDASRAVVRAYGPLLAELGLTYPQYITMLVLWEADGPVSVGDLGARLHLDSGTLSPLIRRLEHVGLVNRRRDPADERRVLISLAAKGSALRTRACDVPTRMAERFGLDADSAAKLRNDLTSVVQMLEAHTEVRDGLEKERVTPASTNSTRNTGPAVRKSPRRRSVTDQAKAGGDIR